MTTNWTQITDSAPWPGRDSPGAVVFRNRMWLLGGFSCDRSGNFSRLRDVWSSPDGHAWDCVLEKAPWPARNLAGCVSFRDRVFLLGGFSGTHTFGDIWSSPDGAHWDCLTECAPWGARGAFGCTVYEDRIWVIGGVNWERQEHYADVWASGDGHQWEKVADGAAWGPRALFPAITHDSHLWIFGGGHYHDRAVNHSDVWRSSDGITWECVTSASGWVPRRFHKALVNQGAIWLIGGVGTGSINRNDVWSSPDGREWTCADISAPWPIRHEFALLEFRDRAWLLGGFAGEIAGNIIYNDVWQMDAGG